MSDPAIRPSIRAATETDVPAIAAIYDHEVRTAITTFDVEPQPTSYWEMRVASTVRGDHFLVAVEEGAVVGFAYAAPYRTRAGYLHTRETSVYLADGARGRGLGRALYDELLALLRADSIHLVVAVIALPNDASESLHRSYGFGPAGVLREVGWKLDRWIDTALWTLTL